MNDSLLRVAEAVAETVTVPDTWGCCGFAGDRGLLHPELTASATKAQAAELAEGRFDAYASCNRTCELGMTRATGTQYQHSWSWSTGPAPNVPRVTVPADRAWICPLFGCVQAMYGPVDRDLGSSHPVRVRSPSARSRELAIAPGRRV